MRMKRKQNWIILAGLALGIAVLRKQKIGDPPTDYTIHGFTKRSLITPAGRMNYYEAGTGEPLIFLHGIGGGVSSWTWSKVAPAFINQYRVIVPDWVGWGSSEHPRRYLLFSNYVAELDTLLQHVGQPAHVVAQSLAAGFAVALAQMTPERFTSLTLMTPSGGKDFGQDDFKLLQRHMLTPLARKEPFNRLFYRALFHRRFVLHAWLRSEGFYESAAVSRKIVDAFLYSSRQPCAAYSVLPFLSGDLRYDIAPYLRDLPVPAMMLWGTQERTVGRRTGEKLAALNPNIPLTFIRRARTNFELELPAQTIALIQRFLSEMTGSRTHSSPDTQEANYY